MAIILLSVLNSPVLDKEAMAKAPYLNIKTPPTSEMLKLVVCNKGVLAAVPVVFWLNVGQVNEPELKLPEEGVPSAGVINVGEEANTTAPEPVLDEMLMFGVEPPLEAKGEEALTLETPVPVADSVPPVKLTPVPMVTLLNPPEPLPYKIALPDVAGA